MKNRGFILLFLAFFLVLFLPWPIAWGETLSPSSWQIRSLPTGEGQKASMSISGNLIVWEDWRNGNGDIYCYDLEKQQEKAISAGQYSQSRPFIDGKIIVWQEYLGTKGTQICSYDLTTGQERVLDDFPSSKWDVSVSGNIVVWYDCRNDQGDIYLYDLAANKEKKLTGQYAQTTPVISGNLIVWSETREYRGDWNLYLHDLALGQTIKLTEKPGSRPFYTVKGDKVVWFEGLPEGGYDCYLYDYREGEIRKLFHLDGYIDVTTKQFFDGKRVLWLQYDTKARAYSLGLYDLTAKEKIFLAKDKLDPMGMALGEEKVVWFSGQEWGKDLLYLAEPGPGSALLPPVLILPGITASWTRDGAIWSRKDPWLPLSEGELGNWKPGFILSGNSLTNPYKGLQEALEKKGYQPGKNLFVVPYDWRRSNYLTARDFLAPAVARAQEIYRREAKLPEDAPVQVDIIAHSMGGLVARSYLQDHGGQGQVNRLIMLGTPNYGSPKAYFIWEGGHFPSSWKPAYEGADFLVDRVLQSLINSYAGADEIRPGILESMDSYRKRLGTARVKAVRTYVPAVGELMPVRKEGAELSYLEEKDETLLPLGLDSRLYYQNEFLQRLNDSGSLARLNEGARVMTIRGSSPGGGATTRSLIKVEEGAGFLWDHGKPVEVNLSGDQKWFYQPEEDWFTNQGDGTVLWESTILPGSHNSTKVVSAGHGSLPKASGAWQQIFAALGLPAETQETGSREAKRMLFFSLNCPADLLVIDPLGRKVGYDPANGGEVNDLGEEAFYSGAAGEGQVLVITEPLSGNYQIRVAGRGTGHFLATFSSFDEEDPLQAARDLEVRGTVEEGKILDYQLAYFPGTDHPLAAEPEDRTPPKTTITTRGTPGAGGWYASPVWVELAAEDEPAGEGVAETVYSLDGGQIWHSYEGPFLLAGDGTYEVLYCSRDYQDNLEEIQKEKINIDSTPPELILPALLGNYWFNQSVDLSFDARDNLAGVARITATLNGKPVLPGQWVLATAGPNNFRVTAVDRAGNEREEIITFNVNYRVKWFPPLGQNSEGEPRYLAEADATIPVKFGLYDYQGNFVRDEKIRLALKDSQGDLFAEYGGGTGSNSLRINPSGEHYLAICHLRDLAIGGTGEFILEVLLDKIVQGRAVIKIK